MLLRNIGLMASVVASIGASDAVEYHISPAVHKAHNCPDIMGMRWSDYKTIHAFISGVKCSWFLILPLVVFPHSTWIIMLLNAVNIGIPIFCWLTRLDKKDMFLAHIILYAVNPIFLCGSIALGLLNVLRAYRE
jgi:hypothetical protein